ncbi:MAG: threonine synthase [Planctomycetales bacterium]|nr:threonine synthase [Planctomycetales bacterium]
MTSFVSHLEAAIDGTILPADRLQTLHNDRPLWVRYDMQAVARTLTKEKLRERPLDMWRYRELLPVPFETEPVSLGEGQTPLLPCPRIASRYGLEQLWIKDESHLPTGSFKSRGLAMAITMAKHLGVRRVALPSAGNAGGAAAAYAARAGLEAYVFMPEDTPVVNLYECRLAGAKTFLVNGLITDCGRIVREGKQRMNWFDLSTLKEPYRIEGKKTMGLELAEQFDWQLPDVILYPTGGGTGLIGMWKAFQELSQLGWLKEEAGRLTAPVPSPQLCGERARVRGESFQTTQAIEEKIPHPHPLPTRAWGEGTKPKFPRMVSVQSTGCAPIAKAFEAGSRFAEPFANAATIASGIRVPAAVGDFMILAAVQESGGVALQVEEARIREWMHLVAASEGIAICPETAACIGALERLTRDGWIKPHERVVVFNTGAAQKYVEAMKCDLPKLDITRPIDWDWLSEL